MPNITIVREIEFCVGDVDFYEDCDVEIDYSLGCDNRNSGEMMNINGKNVRGPSLDPPEPAELEITDVSPHNPNIKWSEDMTKAIIESLDIDEMWSAIGEDEL